MEDFADLLDDDVELLAEPSTKRKRKRKLVFQWIGCPLPWFNWVVGKVHSKRQLAMALMLYRRCCLPKSRTVTMPTTETGLNRQTKADVLAQLKRLGIVRIKPRGRSPSQITLVGWAGDGDHAAARLRATASAAPPACPATARSE